jgi:ectoine hydroxylase-related dioxygenase (phytanoyl-CoA dioxygenase family)
MPGVDALFLSLTIVVPTRWLRDGPSVFTNQHHVSHCINVFVPLIDVSTANGTTEFVPGTHDDRLFEQVAGDVVKTAEQDPAEQHKLAVRADVKAGTAVVFDTRVLHRGLANASMQERPVLYFTMAREWFTEQHMFQTESVVQNPRRGSPENVWPLISVCVGTCTGPQGYRLRASPLYDSI